MDDKKLQALEDGALTTVSGGAYNGPVFVYQIKAGDSLDSIARRYDTNWQILAELNRIANPGIIQVGTKIYVPSNF
jgi:Predicted glycosyl hydrolase